MGAREQDKRLQKLFDEGKKVYSISKLNTIENCEYEAWNTYIKKLRGKNGIYGILGGKIHDKLEAIINKEATESDLIPTLQEELNDLDMLNIGFPKDFKGGDSIRDSWVADMRHFCNNFIKPKGNFTTEELVIYKINEERYLQGYIDLIKHNKDKSISIYDWKTSSQFTKEDLLHHGRQLVLYAMAKEQEGIVVKEVAWIMLKYVEITYMGKAKSNSKNKTLITKICNRGKIIKELESSLVVELNKLGYDEIDIDIMISEAQKLNSLDAFPDVIKQIYNIKPYVRRYELTDELRHEALDYINTIADRFESKSDDEDEWKPRKFTKPNKQGVEKEDTFFCHVLCNNRDTCKHIKKFDDIKELNKTEEDDLF
jgi:hypothetical protein